MEQEIKIESMWAMDAGGTCGVFMPRHVMRKWAKLAARYQESVRALLNEHADELLPASWTLNKTYIEDGRQVIVQYYDKDECWNTVRDRIELFIPIQPRAVDVYHCTRSQAETVAREIARGER